MTDDYERGAVIVWPLAFLGSSIYAIAEYGWFWGLGLGWLPSIFIALIVALLWPLLALLLALGVLGLILAFFWVLL